MKLLVGLVALLYTISLIFAAPIQTIPTDESTDLLLRRALEDESNAVLFHRSPESEPPYKTLVPRRTNQPAKKNREQDTHKVNKLTNIGKKNKEAMSKTKGKEKQPRPATTTGKTGALKNNKSTKAQSISKNPKPSHKTSVKSTIAKNPKQAKAGKSSTANPLHPARIGGKGKPQGLKAQSGRGSAPCTICAATFPRQTDLDRHVIATHVKGPPYQCLGCKGAFDRADAIQRHWDQQPACKDGHCDTVRNS